MSFFTLGNHHDFALVEVGDAAPSPHPAATGLSHVAFKVGDSLDEFRRVEAALDAAGVAALYEADRAFTKSLHVEDPDGHEVELYIDTSDAWMRRDGHGTALPLRPYVHAHFARAPWQVPDRRVARPGRRGGVGITGTGSRGRSRRAATQSPAHSAARSGNQPR